MQDTQRGRGSSNKIEISNLLYNKQESYMYSKDYQSSTEASKVSKGLS